MCKNFFPNRALFWSFWANIVFTFGMIGYLLMDGLDYMRPNALNDSLPSIIYVVLAAMFVIDSTLQIFSIYKTNRSTPRYFAMVLSCIFDKVGSDTYFLGALFSATAFTSSNTVWVFYTVGVCGFVIGAAINMLVRGPNALYFWANNLNLLGSLLYLLAIFITVAPVTHIIAIVGDVVYLTDAILYTICWFSDRKQAISQGEQTLLVNK